MKPLALILQAHGTNRDLDVMQALTLAGADAIGMPLNELRSHKQVLQEYQMLVVPGGFSYADALGAGKLLAVDLASYFAEQVADFVELGKPVIGICNGFQALVKAGILPGKTDDGRVGGAFPSNSDQAPNAGGVPDQQEADSAAEKQLPGSTLTFNAGGRFECRWVDLKPVSQACLWTHGLDGLIACPIAHGEGNFQVTDRFPLADFVSRSQIALIYVEPDGEAANGRYPANPNGSMLDIAGICNPRGNVLGLMPHPENHIFEYQHPRFSRGESGGCGLLLFENGVNYARQM